MKRPSTCSRRLPRTGSNFTKVIRISLSCCGRTGAGLPHLLFAPLCPPNKKRCAHSTDAERGSGRGWRQCSILNGAPHPNAALLWARWAISEEGQNIYAQAGETPAHPNVEPTEKTRPAAIYLLSATDHPSHESTELQCDPRILEVFLDGYLAG